MKTMLLKNLCRITLALALGVAAHAADRIELTDGSVVYGKLLGAEGGKFKVETDFAGKIEIAQGKIKSFTTDEPVNIELKSGSTVLGPVQATATGGIVVVATDGQVTADTGKVAAVWRAGTDSPTVRELKERAEKAKRKWAYEASLAINGRTGGSERFAGAVGLKATLESAQDKLIFVLQAEKAQDNGVETANRQFGGVDYSSFFDDKDVWYVRTSVEKDSIKELDLRSTTAFGVGHKFIKNKVQDLELRLGVNYIYENYANGTQFDSPGLDVALIHGYTFHNGRLNNLLGYTPAFKDFGNYRIHHETSYEMPITASLWKLKTGISNDYTSIPQPGVRRLDTLYFTSLILNWK